MGGDICGPGGGDAVGVVFYHRGAIEFTRLVPAWALSGIGLNANTSSALSSCVT